MHVFKIITTVLIGLILILMGAVLATDKKNNKGFVGAVFAVTIPYIMALVCIWG